MAGQLAGVLGSADEATFAAPLELSGRAARSYEDAGANTRAALGETSFKDESQARGG
ncbi:MAG TPA: hypothetical protein VNN06_17350 [Ramlibacter sp.]|nr:hypothetical protein [Ramlibacter sp.]